jgi:hypothetical protein
MITACVTSKTHCNIRWEPTIIVSEDFDMSLRLQMAKFIVRLATYHNGGFKEGVSLTVYDEPTRWEKYVIMLSIFSSSSKI